MTMRLLLLALGLLLSAPAGAQPARPRIQPIRDVSVTYRLAGEAAQQIPGGAQDPVTLSWDATGQRLRAEMDGRSQVALVDLRNHTGEVIDTGLRVVLPLPVRSEDLQPLTLEGARLTAVGKDVVAGQNCTTYTVESGRTPGTVCLTADGVALKGAGEVRGKPGSFVATRVAYGTIPPSRFEIPPGYISLSGKGPGGGLSGLRALGNSLGLSLPTGRAK